MRCFISISIPEEIKKGLSAIQDRLKKSGADVSWTKPDGMHLTLKFLGEIPVDVLGDKGENKISDIETALNIAVAGIGPFTLDVSGIGVFPDIRRPRVVWIGLTEDGHNLTKLQRGIERELEQAGFPAEKRKFTPHLTLGRIRSYKRLEQLMNFMEEGKNAGYDNFTVSNVHLMKSDLRPEGAVYTELYLLKLKGE